MALDPISTHGGITNLAKHIVSVEHEHWKIPDGTILAPVHKRAGAFMLDVIFVNALLSILSGSRVMLAWNLSMWTSADWDHSFAWAIAILFGHFLYWRYTGLILSRSLGQRLLGLAIVRDNGDAMESEDWDRRSVRKLLYLLPIINIWFIVRDVFRMHQRHTHQSEIDLAAGSIVAIANSLPVAHRGPIR
ncbi:MAG: Uncharacterised protein [Methanobacteriota archaeon]|nr:MAG: Uncharacterised protein [Euryarchaeota archaeon]